MDLFLTLVGGFGALLDWTVLAFMISGFLIGTFFGAMPGLTSVLAIALLLPITYTIDVVPALVMSASIGVLPRTAYSPAAAARVRRWPLAVSGRSASDRPMACASSPSSAMPWRMTMISMP